MTVAHFIADQRTFHRVPHAASCRLLGVSEAWFYKWNARAATGALTTSEQQRRQLDQAVAAMFKSQNGLHGSPRLVHDLRDAGWTVSEKTVAGSMRRQGLVARVIRRRRNTTRQDKTKRPFPDLLRRDFTASAPNEKWCGDMTEIPVPGHGKLYLATVIDLYSRRLLAASVGLSPNATLARQAIQIAVTSRGGPEQIKDVIFHTDRGSTYTAQRFSSLCERLGVRQSMGRVGSCFDALAESFVDTFKTELIRDRVWRTRSQLELAVVEYVSWFNHARLHESLGDIPPVEYEAFCSMNEGTAPLGSSPLYGSKPQPSNPEETYKPALRGTRSASAPARAATRVRGPSGRLGVSRSEPEGTSARVPVHQQVMHVGVDSFVSTVTDPATDRLVGAEERIEHLLEEIELADASGLYSFGIGEHHREEFYDSAPPILLAAAAARTSKIRLSSAVTVLSAADPVRVFQQFATLDLIAKGRADLIVGRGSFTEAFPLFGLDLTDYDSLFSEKLDLLLRIRDSTYVTWSGRHRPALTGQGVFPRPAQAELPIWVGVGGTPQSFARAGFLGLPLMVAIIGGEPRGFAPLVDLYRRAGREAGHAAEALKVGLHVFGFVADSVQAAADTVYPGWHQMFTSVSRERGFPPPNRGQFDATSGPNGAFFLGDPDTIVKKLVRVSEQLGGVDRVSIQMTNPRLGHADLLRGIALLGQEVAPRVAVQ